MRERVSLKIYIHILVRVQYRYMHPEYKLTLPFECEKSSAGRRKYKLPRASFSYGVHWRIQRIEFEGG